MVFRGRDILISPQCRHPDVRMSHHPDAAFFADAARTQISAQTDECLLQIALLIGRPSRLRREESMLDRVACDLSLSFGRARTRGPRGIASIGLQSS